jgi:hypothetical protein
MGGQAGGARKPGKEEGVSEVAGYTGVTPEGAGYTGAVPTAAASAAPPRQVAGYTGMTASGAGYTGSVPVTVSADVYGSTTRTGGGYSEVLAPEPDSDAGYLGVLSAPFVLQPSPRDGIDWARLSAEIADRLTDEARRRGELAPFVRSDLLGYEYRRDEVIGPALEQSGGTPLIPTDALAMFALQNDPNAFFPFDVLPTDGGENSIRLGGEYELKNRGSLPYPLPNTRGNPVRVVEVTPNSFTFETLPGHFDPPGSRITFRTYLDAEKGLHLEHYGATERMADPDNIYVIGPYVADFTWQKQAANMRNWLDETRAVVPRLP